MNYIRIRKAGQNIENVQVAERKENQNSAIISYATLNDGMRNIIYENVPEDGLSIIRAI